MSSEPNPSAGASNAPSGPPTRRPFGFPRSRRLTKPAELDAVRQRGKRVRTEHLEVRVLPPSADAGEARIGVIVPRHKHSAVDRNRLKRRLRELARIRLLPSLRASHVVIRARAEAYDDSFEALQRQIDRASREIARILNPGAPDTA